MSIDPSSFIGGKDMGIYVGPLGEPLPPSRDADLRRQSWRRPDPSRGRHDREPNRSIPWLAVGPIVVIVVVVWDLMKQFGWLT